MKTLLHHACSDRRHDAGLTALGAFTGGRFQHSLRCFYAKSLPATDAAGSGTRFLALMGQQHGIQSWGVMIMGADSKQCTTFCVREPTPPFLTPYHVRMSVYLHWNLRRTINEWLYINPRNCTLRDGTRKESNPASTCSCRGDTVRPHKLVYPYAPQLINITYPGTLYGHTPSLNIDLAYYSRLRDGQRATLFLWLHPLFISIN